MKSTDNGWVALSTEQSTEGAKHPSTVGAWQSPTLYKNFRVKTSDSAFSYGFTPTYVAEKRRKNNERESGNTPTLRTSTRKYLRRRTGVVSSNITNKWDRDGEEAGHAEFLIQRYLRPDSISNGKLVLAQRYCTPRFKDTSNSNPENNVSVQWCIPRYLGSTGLLFRSNGT